MLCIPTSVFVTLFWEIFIINVLTHQAINAYNKHNKGDRPGSCKNPRSPLSNPNIREI
ncbi:hypothetical protein JYQ62_33720 [Nostoc sp. UHCC 0702]|nr:hypothetical protein JYQ62_33720 [Nostoc sp. UHCC 0702]